MHLPNLFKKIKEIDFKELEMRVLNDWIKYSTVRAKEILAGKGTATAIDELQQKLSGKVKTHFGTFEIPSGNTEIFVDEDYYWDRKQVEIQPRGNGKSFKLENFGIGSEALTRMFKESFKEDRVLNDGVPANEPKELKAKKQWWNEQALSPVNPIDRRKRDKKRSERRKARLSTRGR